MTIRELSIRLERNHYVVYAIYTLYTFLFPHNPDTRVFCWSVHNAESVQMLFRLSTPNTYYNQAVCSPPRAAWRTLCNCHVFVACPTVLVCNILCTWRCHICDTSFAVSTLFQWLSNRCIHDAILSIIIINLAFVLDWIILVETDGKSTSVSYAPLEW